jgi:Gly-Xaa carboxypeptidase
MIDLEQSFPKTHETLKRTKVVTHALVYEWEGSDPSLKPLLLTGHQGTSFPRVIAMD